MKRSNEQTLKSALNEWLRTTRLDSRLHEHMLKERWEEIFGKSINRYTRRIQVKNHVLFLTVESAPLRQELLYHKQMIMERINREIAEDMIRDVVIR